MSDEKRHSEILEDVLQFIYPLIILFGMYVILTGISQPGGGFQGGAILVAIFMCRYLVSSKKMARLDLMQKIDKLILVFILALASLFILLGFRELFPYFNDIYNMLIGILIGIKVASGLTVIFYTFAFIEGGEED
ncbi:MAG TPA: MnhB domain-containing protein [Clostridia bacterium]|nr:MnhB domain-containing protein [Clostridia bacterium]HPQ46536.1 MnhB domain-containing protein [Clostridia bacterium]HRX42436.1 MnhB domain-containing protein [Clostridia bacterium]